MSPFPVLLAVSVAASLQALPRTGDSACVPTVTARQGVAKGMPSLFYDQGRASIAVMHPGSRWLVDRREGRLGDVFYSLLVFQPMGSGSVELQAAAVDGKRERTVDLSAKCSTEAWPSGLIAMLEAIASVR